MIVTVTLNTAIDRTLIVPNFRPGRRHRASGAFRTAGARASTWPARSSASAPRRLHRPGRGRTGTLIVEELTAEGILNDFVRIRDESRTSIAVLDPTANAYSEINEWGPQVGEDELDVLREKVEYLAQGAEFVVLAGLASARRRPGFYAEFVRELGRRQLLAVLDTEGEPLRLGLEGEPYLVAPNGREAEALVGTSSSTRRTSSPGSTRSPGWARATRSSRWRLGATRCCGRIAASCACARSRPA